MITMEGPQPDTIALSVPATVTAAANTGSIQVTAGQGKRLRDDGVHLYFLQWRPLPKICRSTVEQLGPGFVTFANLTAGNYQVEAQVADSAGHTVIALQRP